MSIERRFGLANVVFAAGMLVLAAGNAAIGESRVLVGGQVVMALGAGVLGAVLASGRADVDADGAHRRWFRYGAVALAVTGLALSLAGLVLVLGL